jgi:hypothetical protein
MFEITALAIGDVFEREQHQAQGDMQLDGTRRNGQGPHPSSRNVTLELEALQRHTLGEHLFDRTH